MTGQDSSALDGRTCRPGATCSPGELRHPRPKQGLHAFARSMNFTADRCRAGGAPVGRENPVGIFGGTDGREGVPRLRGLQVAAGAMLAASLTCVAERLRPRFSRPRRWQAELCSQKPCKFSVRSRRSSRIAIAFFVAPRTAQRFTRSAIRNQLLGVAGIARCGRAQSPVSPALPLGVLSADGKD